VGVHGGQSDFWVYRNPDWNSGHCVWRLFFEETEKRELPMKSLHKLWKIIVAVMLAAFAPTPLFACAFCGGVHSDSTLAHGMNWGIFTLMGVIGTVLACVALFFVHIVRKEEDANQHEHDEHPQNPPNV
jgi:uncharacterized membrane protein